MAEEKKQDTAAILEEARERFAYIIEQDRDNRDAARENIQFVFTPGKQWSDEQRQRRKAWKEECLEFNQLKQFVHQVINDMRQARPGIRVHAANGKASKETAEILQGLVRNIENESKAEACYDNATSGAVVGGRGWWRVCSDYVNEASFDQKLMIKPIADPLSVYADMDYQEPDGSDRNYVFVVEAVPTDEFKRKWPDADVVSWDTIDRNWMPDKDTVYVADYYRRVCEVGTLVLMSDGNVGWKEGMPTPPEGVTIVKDRKVERYRVEWYKVAGGEQILETYQWPGTIIPVICVPGDDMIIDSKRCYQGLVNEAKDTQRMFNFGMTQQAIHLALTPKAPWVAPKEAIAGYEDIYKNANVNNYAVLPYNHKDASGESIPAPQRAAPSLPDAGWINWCNSMTGLLKSTIGMYENNLGQRAQEVSGRAILAREKQGDNATFHFVDNLSRAIALTGRIIIEVIPKFYDTERIVHIIGPDDTRKMVAINQTTPNPNNPMQAIRNNDVTVGEYAVTVEAGPSYATKRQETSESLMQFVNAFPPAAQVAGDLIVKSLDIADADIIAERLKLTLPPAVLEADAAKKEGRTPPDPMMVAKLQQLQQQLEQAMQTMQAMDEQNKELKTGAAAKQAEVQIKAQELDVSKYEAETKRLAIIADAEKKQAEIMAQHEETQRAIAELQIKIAQEKDSNNLERYKAELTAHTQVLLKQIDNGQLVGEGVLPAITAINRDVVEDLQEHERRERMMEMQGQTLSALQSLIGQMGGKKRVTLPDGRVATVESLQ